MWLRYLTVAFLFGAFLVTRSLFAFTLIEALLVGAVLGGVLALVAKLVWALANPERA